MAAKKAKSRAKSSHGGRRVGAGRKQKLATELRSDIVAESERLICSNLPGLIANMLRLANGGYQRVEEKFEPDAVTVTNPDGTTTTKVEMVLVERKVSTADADRAANIYLIDRVMGKPKQATEAVEPDASESGTDPAAAARALKALNEPNEPSDTPGGP